MAKVKEKVRTKLKKKQWVPIYAPKSFNNIMLGETYVQDKDSIVGKSITQSLMIIKDDPRKQGYTVRFDVTDMKDGKAQTQVLGMNMTPSAIKRLIRRHRDKISDSFVLKIAGGRLVRVKPSIVTRTKTSRPSQTKIRLQTREFLRSHWAKMRFDDIVHNIIEMKIQRQLKDICSKTHPVRTADIQEVIVLPEARELTAEMSAQIEKEVAEETKKREHLESAAAVAAVEQEVPPKKVVKKIVKKE